MFGRRFAYGYQGSGEEGWTPPWLRQEREWQGQHLPGEHHSHGPFGHRGPFGHGGFVTSQDVEGKKVYSITDAGRALLAERQKNEQEFEGPPWMRHRGFGRQHRFSPEMQALKSEAMEVVRLLTIAGRMSFQDPEH